MRRDGAARLPRLALLRPLTRRAHWQGPGYVWDQTPEAVEVEVALPEGPAAKARDVQVDVKPTRMRVCLRGVPLLEGKLGGEVLADEGEWEWELKGAGDASPSFRLTLAKRCARAAAAAHWLTLRRSIVSHRPEEQWSSLLVGPEHPLIDTQRLSWTRKRPWRPPQDARTREEVARALPGNRILDALVNELRPEKDGGEGGWGDAWRKGKPAGRPV